MTDETRSSRSPAASAATTDGGGALLAVDRLVQEYTVRGHGGVKGGVLQAVSGVTLQIGPGEALGLVGETGSGKSTLARSILQLPRPRAGSVKLEGRELTKLRRGALRSALRSIQMVFQDPYSSMNPKWRIWDVVEEPLVGYEVGTRATRRARANELLEQVGIPPSLGARRPRELSGGQCQRVAIARALALSPSLIICDEAVSALDVVIQAQVLALFRRLRGELGLSYLFIAHDLAAVRQVSDKVAVMYLGKLCEVGPVDRVFSDAAHPYTAALLASATSTRRPGVRISIKDKLAGEEPPSPLDPPSGCRFRTRCPRATERCAEEEPMMRALGGGHEVACHDPLGRPQASSAGSNAGASARS